MRPVQFFLFTVLLWLGSVQTALAAAYTPDCSTPVGATKTLLKNLLKDNWHRTEAATCIQGNEKAALQLKQILDAQGIYIDYSKLPNDTEYVNESGTPQVAIDIRLPEIQWERQADNSWQLSTSSIQNIQNLYQDTFSSYVSSLLDKLPASFFETVLGFQIWQYLLFVIILLFSWLAGRLVDRVIYGQILKFIEKHQFFNVPSEP